MDQVLLFITDDDHSIAQWFEIPRSKFTKELEQRIFDKEFGYSDYYSTDNKHNKYKFENVDESEMLDAFLNDDTFIGYDVFKTLQQKYFKSDVTSGEFYYQVKDFRVCIYTEDEMRIGIQRFLDWDESEAKFELKKNRVFWKIIDK